MGMPFFLFKFQATHNSRPIEKKDGVENGTVPVNYSVLLVDLSKTLVLWFQLCP